MNRSLQEIKRDLRGLSSTQLQQVAVWVQKLLSEAEGKKEGSEKSSSNDLVLEEQHRGGKTYRLEYTRCGKAGCKCATGDLHGPYWYAYWTEEGKTKSHYVGKELGR
jgi:hypothetical protein